MGPRLIVPDHLRAGVTRIRRQALRYVRQCTALQVAPERLAILADHRILPLSWTRDAYYQALLLLADRHADVDSAAATSRVADHLRWLWLDCVRPAAGWARSHHADGRRKDERFQADQQLYPLLELADFWRVTGRLPELGGSVTADRREWSRMVDEVLHLLQAWSADHGLLASEENPADDELLLPYLFSTQVLAWFALHRLAELSEVLELAARPAAMAEATRRTALDHFAVAQPDVGVVWAYAVDGRGASLLLHDANDLPTAFAPLWGFCAPDDPVWRATVDFAFGPANPVWVRGPTGGLGSHHTPGTWSLGLIQEWVARGLAADEEQAADALTRLISISLEDWSLPEASDPANGHLLARPWFAWPGATVGALLALDERSAWQEWIA